MRERLPDAEASWGQALEMVTKAINEGRMVALCWNEKNEQGNPRYVSMGYPDGRLELLAFLEQLGEPPAETLN